MAWLNVALESERLAALLRAGGPAPRAQLQASMGLSQPSLSRLLTRLPGVVRLGQGRNTRYALQREVPGVGSAWALRRIDARGKERAGGRLAAVAPSGWKLDAVDPVLHGSSDDEVLNRLPWCVEDLRPTGFLGRAWALELAAARATGEGPDPQRWTSNGLLAVLAAEGSDLPGDLVVGDRALQLAADREGPGPMAVDPADRTARYQDLADAVMAGATFGSSSGGEQPKFTAAVGDGPDGVRRVLVKFTESTPSAARRRWADLMVCEHHALEVLAQHAVPASRSELVFAGPRVCLEVTRFDRVGRAGRIGMVSLTAVDAEWAGDGHDWLHAAASLEALQVISASAARTLRRCWWFGRLIGNTDMHLGNQSFFLGRALPLALTPAYDMVPMLWAPVRGEVLERTLTLPALVSDQRADWEPMGQAALDFWGRAAADSRISSAFRATSELSRQTVAAALERFS